jgi:predicted DsbA family dithiol-disulfide isomerase
VSANILLQIEVVSDYVCPWCYVGKRRLESAIAQRPDLDIEVSWRPFQLSPDMPRAGRKRLEHYQQIFGAERAQTIMDSMQDTGRDEGIAFGSSPDAMSPNTLSGHVLLLWAREHGNIDTNALAEKLFYAHHVACENIGDHAVLARIAGEAGMDATQVRRDLAAGKDEDRAQQLMQESVARGVSGVPFFIINGRYGVSGAQPTDAFLAAFEQIVAAGDAAT